MVFLHHGRSTSLIIGVIGSVGGNALFSSQSCLETTKIPNLKLHMLGISIRGWRPGTFVLISILVDSFIDEKSLLACTCILYTVHCNEIKSVHVRRGLGLSVNIKPMLCGVYRAGKSQFGRRIDSAELIESISSPIQFVWPSAMPVPALHACW